jgi:hypothetical protein
MYLSGTLWGKVKKLEQKTKDKRQKTKVQKYKDKSEYPEEAMINQL